MIILVTALVRVFIAAKTGLGTGEAYYFKGVQVLDWSYFDQPPLFFWLSRISTTLVGETNLGLRLPAILLFMGTSWLMYKSTKMLFNDRAGLFAVVLLNTSLVFTIPVAAWFQPDAPLMFFWMLTAYMLMRIFFKQPEESPALENYRKSTIIYTRWILVGVALGLTTLSKYHSLFLLLGAALFCVFDRRYRHWFTHPGPYLAIVINLLIATPIFIWNAENNWVSFLFQGSRAGSSGFKLYPHFVLRSIAGQAVWLAPWIWVPLIVVMFRAWKKRVADARQAFIFWTAVLPIFFFTIVCLWTNTLFHFHWQAPGYMMLFILLGWQTEKRINEGRKRTLVWLRASVLLTIFFSTIILLQAENGILRPVITDAFLQKYMGGRDPTIEGYDYDDIETRFKKEGWYDDDNIFVGTTRWWQAGKIDWALKGTKPLVVFHFDPRNHAYFTDPKKLVGQDAILLSQNPPSVLEYYVEPFFDRIDTLPDLEIKRNGYTELTIDVYRCYNFHLPEEPRENMPVYSQLKGEAPF